MPVVLLSCPESCTIVPLVWYLLHLYANVEEPPLNVPIPPDGISPLAWAAAAPPVVAVVGVVAVVALCEDEL